MRSDDGGNVDVNVCVSLGEDMLRRVVGAEDADADVDAASGAGPRVVVLGMTRKRNDRDSDYVVHEMVTHGHFMCRLTDRSVD